MDYSEEINNYIAIEKKKLDNLDRGSVSQMISKLNEALEKESTVYVFGNGGSAATASHIANDLNKGVSEGLEKKFRCICLSDNIATLTAIANDISYEESFSEQLKGRLKPGDLVIALSGSGNSANVVNAARYAKFIGTYTIGITGYSGGELGDICDLHVHVNVSNMQIAEDIHMMLAHLVMSILCRHLKGKEHLSDG